jgi:hypothetical protein
MTLCPTKAIYPHICTSILGYYPQLLNAQLVAEMVHGILIFMKLAIQHIYQNFISFLLRSFGLSLELSVVRITD